MVIARDQRSPPFARNPRPSTPELLGSVNRTLPFYTVPMHTALRGVSSRDLFLVYVPPANIVNAYLRKELSCGDSCGYCWSKINLMQPGFSRKAFVNNPMLSISP